MCEPATYSFCALLQFFFDRCGDLLKIMYLFKQRSNKNFLFQMYSEGQNVDFTITNSTEIEVKYWILPLTELRTTPIIFKPIFFSSNLVLNKKVTSKDWSPWKNNVPTHQKLKILVGFRLVWNFFLQIYVLVWKAIEHVFKHYLLH